MYNILVLDDEKRERDVIKYLLEQMVHQFNIIEAPNGKEGLLILEQQPIDIVITDVKMPFIDGIELAEYAKQHYKNLEIIFFSGHDDYDYLKKALLVNAITYILKPVQLHEFFETINQTIEQIIMKRNNKLTDAQKERTFQIHIIRELINGVSLSDLKQQHSPNIDFDFLDSITYYTLYQVSEFSPDKLSKIEQFIMQLGDGVDYIKYDAKQFIICFFNNNKVFEIKNNIESMSSFIYNHEGYYVTKRLDSVENFYQSFHEAQIELREKVFYHNQRNDHENEKNEDINREDLLISKVIKAIKIEDRKAFNKNIQNILDYHKNHTRVSIPFVKFFYANFVEVISKETMVNWSEDKETTIQKIIEADNMESILKIIESMVSIINKYLDDSQESSNLYVKEVKKYITSNYEKELYLDLLANQVSLSPRYLSDLFKKEEGIGVNKYIKKIRLTEAKKLLINTRLNISQIGLKVGYHNYSYFVKTFRKEMGLPPEKYRHKFFRISNQEE